MPMRPMAPCAAALLAVGALAVLAGGCGPARPSPGADPVPAREAPRDSVEVGYGRRAADEVAGSVAGVEVSADEAARATRVEQLLEGRFAGVDVVRLPNGRYTIRIRGAAPGRSNAEPLFVLNGVPLIPGSDPLAWIDPSDVARIDVLKDAASTSIYGSRGGNGVILIRTRGGRR